MEKDDGEGDCRKCNKRVSPPHLGSAPLCAVSVSHSQSVELWPPRLKRVRVSSYPTWTVSWTPNGCLGGKHRHVN